MAVLNDYQCEECEDVHELWVDQGDEPMCGECDLPMKRIWSFSIVAKNVRDSAPSRCGSVKRLPYSLKNQKRADYGGFL